MLDAILAWVHFIAIFSFSACLIAEVLFYARTIPATTFSRISRIDIAYGILAVAVIVSGLAHAAFSPKTGTFYLHDWIFWTKMGLFLAVGLLSIVPTMHFIRMRDTIPNAAGNIEIAANTYGTMRGIMFVELALLFCIPLCASLMARGYGAF